MIEVFLFSISISIDALGYSMGFGAKNIKIKKIDFFVLNIINSIILILCLNIFKIIFNLLNPILIENISYFLLISFGLYNIIISFLKNLFSKDKDINWIKNKSSGLEMSDLIMLLLIFIFENMFSAFIFLTTLSNAYLFVGLTFLFHLLFFLVGFDVGNKVAKITSQNSTFMTGIIFLFLAIINNF